ncbi:hypothetical protein O181_114575 [Austropuccinia psidii MF-1]|uniref:Uncharacterized protein n=1 Tax=Austropuccinia psidii MF-1 TaxID=1389203 RepID=A0A9Q3K4P6_9BASI|nr:hypothetical protein [Austropuccinia psidii MF-1]
MRLKQDFILTAVRREVNCRRLTQDSPCCSLVSTPASILDHSESVLVFNYYPPGKSSHQPVSATNPVYQPLQPCGSPSPPAIPGQMIKNTYNLHGRGHFKYLIEGYRSVCLYFFKGRHWYSNFDVFWAKVASGRIVPLNNLSQQANFPSNRSKRRSSKLLPRHF